MTKEQWLQLFTDKGIDTSLYDFRVRNSKYGNEIWCYKKSLGVYKRKVSTGEIELDNGKVFKLKSKELRQYWELNGGIIRYKRVYKYVNTRQGFVIVEKDLAEMGDNDLLDYFY